MDLEAEDELPGALASIADVEPFEESEAEEPEAGGWVREEWIYRDNLAKERKKGDAVPEPVGALPPRVRLVPSGRGTEEQLVKSRSEALCRHCQPTRGEPVQCLGRTIFCAFRRAEKRASA